MHSLQCRHASAHYISKNWISLSILMITYDFISTMTKEVWAVFMKLGTTYSTYENQHLLRLLTLLTNYL